MFWVKLAIPRGSAIPDFTIRTPGTTQEASGALVDDDDPIAIS